MRMIGELLLRVIRRVYEYLCGFWDGHREIIDWVVKGLGGMAVVGGTIKTAYSS